MNKKNLQKRIDAAFKTVQIINECEEDLDILFYNSQQKFSTIPSATFFNNQPEIAVKAGPIKYPENYNLHIGINIKNSRKKSGLTQKQLSDLTNIRRPNIARLEKGESMPNLNTLVLLAENLNVTIEEIIKF